MPSEARDKKLFWFGGILFLLFAFSLRAEYEYTFFPYQYDNGAQIEAARNYVAGQGLKECVVKVTDVSQVVCEEQTWWAIGVPVFLSHAVKLTGDFVAAEYLLRCLGLAIFFLSIFLIYKLLIDEISPISFYLFCLFYAFLYPQYGLTFTSDILSLGFFMAACCCSFYLVFKAQKLSTAVIISLLCGFFLFLTGFMRYAYYPTISIVPFTLLIVSLLRDRKKLSISVVLIGLTILLFFALMNWAFPGHFAANSYFKEKTNGFFPEHLLYFDQFIFKAFFPWELFAPLIESRGKALLYFVNSVIWAVSLVLLYPLLASAYRDFRRLSVESLRPTAYLKLLTIITLFFSVFLLGYLSFKTPKMFEEDTWTYVTTTRYFLPFMVLFQINIFNYVSSLESWKRLSLKTLIAAFLVLAFITHIGVWAAFRYKAYIKRDSRSAFAYKLGTQKKVNELVKAISTNENKPVVLVGNYGLEPLDENIKFVSSIDFYLGIKEIKTSQPVILLIKLPKQLKQIEKDFFAVHNGQKILDLGDADLYRTEINPR